MHVALADPNWIIWKTVSDGLTSEGTLSALSDPFAALDDVEAQWSSQ